MSELDGQVSIVTGGGRGIGRAIAVSLARAGAAVTVTARSADELAETVHRIEAAGGRGRALTADVTDPDAVARVVADTERQLGSVDLLVNNAGVLSPLGPTWEVDPSAWWRSVEVNLRGPFLFARAVHAGMVERRRGRIINVASGMAVAAIPYTSSYSSAKAALVRFTEILAAETSELGIAVFALGPGRVYTAMAEQFWTTPEGRRWLPGVQEIYAGMNVPPERAAAACVFLASGRADGLSGRFLNVMTDDETELAAHAEEIQATDRYTLRLVV